MKLPEVKLPEGIFSAKTVKALKVLGIILVVGLITFLVLAEIASRGVAMIFNREMEKQDMLRGTITTETISANLKGDVVFTNLLWVSPGGDVILRVPEGSFHVRPWDVITRNFKSTTIQKLELHNAFFNVGFNEDMEVDFLVHRHMSQRRRRPVGDKKQEKPPQTQKRNVNFHPDGRKLRVEVILENCRLGAHYRNRHYIMNNVNLEMKLNTAGISHINLSTGRFGGTMFGGGISVVGKVDFKPEIPEMDLDVSIRDVDPESLGFGMKLHDLMTVVAKMTGPVTAPVGRGTVRMKELVIPALHFTDVIGDVNYSNGMFHFTDVNAKVYGGKLVARGDYNLDTRRYNIYGKGTKLNSQQALRNLNFSCLVDMELTVRCNGNPRSILVYGSFSSGKGRYSFIPFDKLEGRFSNRYRELHIYDAKITTPFGVVTTDAFHIINRKLTLGKINLTDMDTGQKITVREADKGERDIKETEDTEVMTDPKNNKPVKKEVTGAASGNSGEAVHKTH